MSEANVKAGSEAVDVKAASSTSEVKQDGDASDVDENMLDAPEITHSKAERLKKRISERMAASANVQLCSGQTLEERRQVREASRKLNAEIRTKMHEMADLKSNAFLENLEKVEENFASSRPVSLCSRGFIPCFNKFFRSGLSARATS
jgi:hypothetical protein